MSGFIVTNQIPGLTVENGLEIYPLRKRMYDRTICRLLFVFADKIPFGKIAFFPQFQLEHVLQWRIRRN